MTAPHPSILSTRCSGILLHPTSLPGTFGIGDLGYAAYEFVNFLTRSGQRLWQILPLGPTGPENSPYKSYSAMAGNPLLISLEQFQQDGFLDKQDFDRLPPFNRHRVNYNQVTQVKLPLLRKAGRRFQRQATPEQKDQFQQFCECKAYWLDDFALFMAIKHDQNGAAWHGWSPEIARRDPAALKQCQQRLSDEVFIQKFLQFEFFRQWSNLKQYANSNGIQIIGDIPIYVADDSADVWANPQNFCLDEATHQPAWVAGAPPDFFSETGQVWGSPVYNWEYLQQTGFHWWLQRFHAMLDYVDLIRIDHFIGFESFWAIPQPAVEAKTGEWMKAPGQAFFQTLKQELGTLPILAEDLGAVTPEVEALRNQFGFPGMKILHFAFNGDPKNSYLPFNFERNFVVYTGTHDNNTTVGWYERLNEQERNHLLSYLGCISADGIHWDMIRLAFSSIANLAIVPLQDVLGLGSESRMNSPGQQQGNWEWRYTADVLTPEICQRLRHLTHFFDRIPPDQSK